MQDDNPLFPRLDNAASPDNGGYLLPRSNPPQQPAAGDGLPGVDAAVNLIRGKLARLYAEAPDPLQEAREADSVQPRSKHQQFMHELSHSGKSIAEVQTEWHNYYISLPDKEKHEVWQEFYAASSAAQHHMPAPLQQAVPPTHVAPTRRLTPVHRVLGNVRRQRHTYPPTASTVVGTVDQDTKQIHSRIVDKVSANGRLQARHHLQSLAFGLSLGFITLVIFLFGFFNEVVIAPFIQPARTVGATPIIVDPSAVTASSTPEIIIPKINLEIPVDFSQTSTDENVIENALEKGIVHYPTTVMPGQTGNTAFFGHSSNNIFNPGKYKFAFVLLHTLVPGDTFYITYHGKVYVYKVFSRRIVDPSEVSVLDNVKGHKATATLITCDPPGTSLHRLVVVGDQISPDPSGNHKGTNTTDVATDSTTQLPGNGPTLIQRIWDSIF